MMFPGFRDVLAHPRTLSTQSQDTTVLVLIAESCGKIRPLRSCPMILKL